MTPELTVVVLNDYCHINGGASRVAVDEAVGLAANGVRVIFFGASGPLCPELQNANIEVICLGQDELIDAGKNPFVLLQGLWNFVASRRMKTLLDTLDAKNTIIHLHGYTKALTASPVRCAIRRGFKVVCTLHDFFTACPNGAFFDYQKRAVCPIRGLSLKCVATHCDKRHYFHKLYRVARGFIQRSVGKLPGGVKDYIMLSMKSVELLRPYLPRDARFHDLENITEAMRQEPVDVAANRDIVFVGRLDIEKGVEDLIQAIRQTNLSLTLVGDGPLRSLAEATPNCRVTGWLTPARVAEELKKARCLVFPSLWYETYGLVVAEAAAHGIPSIVSDISAAAERVENNITGWHMRTGSVADLVRCLELTINNSRLGSAGQAAYNRFWAAPPTRNNHVEELLEIYNKVINDSFIQ